MKVYHFRVTLVFDLEHLSLLQETAVYTWNQGSVSFRILMKGGAAKVC